MWQRKLPHAAVEEKAMVACGGEGRGGGATVRRQQRRRRRGRGRRRRRHAAAEAAKEEAEASLSSRGGKARTEVKMPQEKENPKRRMEEKNNK
jgi:Flp pilus assembly protein TadB